MERTSNAGAILETLLADQRARWLGGDPTSIERYLERHPDLAADASAVIDLIYHEIVLRRQTGHSPSADEYVGRFPELAARIRDQFALDDALQGALSERTAAWGTAPDDESVILSPAQAGALGDPHRIGKYLIVSLLDSGGQALVYRAVHPALGKELVVKIARAPLAFSPAEHDLLVAEGRLLAELEHPNLVRIYDIDVHDARPFLAMEYVRGVTLQQHAEAHRPSPRRSAELMACLARAVAVVHRRGIVHQDLKPKNVLIDESGRLKLIDFGLARLRHAWSEGEANGPSGGTVAYMAPEQARGTWDQVGAGSDVFALGGILYFLLTGRGPFEAPTFVEALARARRCDVDARALREAGVPRTLERICLRALAADPLARPASAEALATDLERFVRGPRRRLAGAVAAALLVVVSVALGLTIRAHRLPRVAVAFSSAASVKVESLDVELHRREPPGPLGTLGSTVFFGRDNDDVRVYARLSAPAYCYLIALNPDGKDQLCYPDDAGTPPARSDEIRYPADPTSGFSLTDGLGLQSFVLVASRRPLPAYRDWLAQASPLPWRPTEASRGWRYDGATFEPMESERGAVRKLADLPSAFATLCRDLEHRPDVEAVRAVAFPVRGRVGEK